MSQGYAVARIEVPVALTADVEQAEQVAVDAAEAALEGDPVLADKVLGEPKMLGVQEWSPDVVKLRMTIKTRPNAQWSVQRRLRREIHRAYDVAVPHRDRGHVHVGPDDPARTVERRQPGLAHGRPGRRHQPDLVVLGGHRHPWAGHVGAAGEADPVTVGVATQVDGVHLPVRVVAPLGHLEPDGGTAGQRRAHAGTRSRSAASHGR